MTSLYFQHEHTGHSIGAKLCESHVVDDVAILRLTLSPVDSNQKQDESYLHEEVLISASLNDEVIIKGFIAHVKQSPNKISGYVLEVISRQKKLEFTVFPDISNQGNLKTLHLNVKNA